MDVLQINSSERDGREGSYYADSCLNFYNSAVVLFRRHFQNSLLAVLGIVGLIFPCIFSQQSIMAAMSCRGISPPPQLEPVVPMAESWCFTQVGLQKWFLLLNSMFTYNDVVTS
ncbi:hypothetical protein CEXT_226591 [Caerostris extrusa]|uniref:Uncharacterized protein n=1 Tax=Caerostris extrusa TaxID=172846 RepID=A0AAV4VM28_CAEEX|nr:hypothetical protein CEXT_226591 [Caerostris extrusa]